MATQVINFKRGDTFQLECTRTTAAGLAFDLTDYTITSQVRGSDFSGNLTVTVSNASAGEFRLTATPTATASWPVERLECDVQFVDVATESTDTFIINNIEDVTRAS